MKTYGQWLREARESFEICDVEFARLVDVPVRLLLDWEDGVADATESDRRRVDEVVRSLSTLRHVVQQAAGANAQAESVAVLRSLEAMWLDSREEERQHPADSADLPIIVWAWRESPVNLRELSPHGGDEDWLAELPPAYSEPPIWMEEGSRFGCCSVSWHEHPTRPDWHVAIGTHS